MTGASITTATLGQAATRWTESGTGAAGQALLVHSLGLDGTAYGALREALGTSWKLACHDQRGHGGAAGHAPFSLEDLVADALAAIARMRAGGPVHLVGHSMGGAVAALAAAQAPEDVASLSLIATPPDGMPAFDERAARLDPPATPRTPDTADASEVNEATLSRWFQGEPAGPAHDAVRKSAGQRLAAMRPADQAAAWRALARFNGPACFGAVRMPAQCIAAAQDASTPPQAMQRIVDAMQPGTNARLHIVVGAGHMVPLTRAGDVARLLTAHWISSASHS